MREIDASRHRLVAANCIDAKVGDSEKRLLIINDVQELLLFALLLLSHWRQVVV